MISMRSGFDVVIRSFFKKVSELFVLRNPLPDFGGENKQTLQRDQSAGHVIRLTFHLQVSD